MIFSVTACTGGSGKTATPSPQPTPSEAAATPAATPAAATPTAAAKDATVSMFQLKVEIDPALQAYAKKYTEATPGVTVKVETLGGGADYAGAMKAKLQANQMPDIFVVEGQGGYDLWKDYIADLSDQPWVKDTDLAFKNDGKVVGFPVAIEGFGLAYNADILQKAGVDPASLKNFSAIKKAFETVESKKAELGLDSVVSMAASVAGGMWWVAAQHNLCVYWGGGLGFDDTSVIDKALKGEIDTERFTEYANYLKLLFDYSDKNILLNGNYDAQVGAFAQGKAAFLHQGNWVDPNMKQLNVTFKMGYAPHAFSDKADQTGLYLFAPSWYVVNSKSPNAEAAKAFLTAMATTPDGHDYMVKQAGMIPAFKSVTLKPEGQLSQALMEANAKGGNYGVFFGKLPDGTGQNVFGPIYDLFAQDTSKTKEFIQDMTDAIAELPKK